MPTVEDRLATIEQDVSYLKQDVSYLKGYMEHVATKSDVNELRAEMADMKQELMTQLTWRMFGMIVGMFVSVSSVAAVAIAVSQNIFD